MPHGIDTAVHAMETSSPDTALDRILTTPQATELVDRHHAMLPRSNAGYAGVDLGELLAHYTG